MPRFLEQLHARAAATPRRIAFAEAGDPRVLAAVARLQATGVAIPVLVLDPADTGSHAAARATGAECIDPAAGLPHEKIADAIHAARAAKGMTRDDAVRHAADPLFAATWLLATGQVHGVVAGAVRTSADVIRSALWLVGTAPGVRSISSAFYMVRGDGAGWSAADDVLTFTDCAVVPAPSAAQLVDIAQAAAAARRLVVGDEPRVAFLSFSTKGSAASEDVTRVQEAVRIFRDRCPEISADGELQGDAALVSTVGQRKAPGSPVAGAANVLVFPSLDAGNIAYKLVERLAGAHAIGPILQGLARPVCDLSRGAGPDAIFDVAAVTALLSLAPAAPPA